MNQKGLKQDIWAREFFTNIACYAIILIPAAIIIRHIQRKYAQYPESAPFLFRICALDHKPFKLTRRPRPLAFLTRSSVIYRKLPSTLAEDVSSLATDYIPNGIARNNLEDQKNEDYLPPRPESQSTSRHDKPYYGTLLFCFCGLQLVFLTWGIVQEKIITKPYRRRTYSPRLIKGTIETPVEYYYDNFTDSQFLVFTNKLSGFCLAGVWLLTRPYVIAIWSAFFKPPRKQCNKLEQNYNDEMSTTNLRPALYRYSYASLSNILSSWCQYEALKYVSFPTQVLFKSGKIIPVMIMSKFMSAKKKTYPVHEYLCAGLVSLGIAMFLISRRNGGSQRHSADYSPQSLLNSSMIYVTLSLKQLRGDQDWASAYLSNILGSKATFTTLSGIILLVGYVIFDSFTSNWQAQLFERYNQTSPSNVRKNQRKFDNNANKNCHINIGTLAKHDADKNSESFNLARDGDSGLVKSDMEAMNGHANEMTSNHQIKERITFKNFNNAQRGENDKNVTSWDMMCYVNLFSSIFTGLSLVLRDFKGNTKDSNVSSNGLLESIAFARDHDVTFLVDMFTLSLCSALGQIFIFLTISKFGAVTFITAMTIRQGFAVLLSCIIYGHKINRFGVTGILLVFVALFAKIYISARLKKYKAPSKNQEYNNEETMTIKSTLRRWLIGLTVLNRIKLKKKLHIFGV